MPDQKGDWYNKSDRFIWRGGATGIPNLGDVKKPYGSSLDSLHRPLFVGWAHTMTASKRLPIELDIGFASHFFGITYLHKADVEYLRKHYGNVTNLSYSKQFQSKYMMVIDGHGWPARFQTLLSGSSLLFLSTIFVEWLSFVVRPWRHYIPVDIDLSNLEEHLLIAHHNQEKARQVVERANRVYQRHLTFESMQCHLGLLLLEYSELLDD